MVTDHAPLDGFRSPLQYRSYRDKWTLNDRDLSKKQETKWTLTNELTKWQIFIMIIARRKYERTKRLVVKAIKKAKKKKSIFTIRAKV